MQDVLDYTKGMAGIVIAIVVLVALSFGLYALFSPRFTSVDNAKFHNSQQYTDGMANQIEEYRAQYAAAATQQQRDSICAIVREQYGSYRGSLSADQAQFVGKCAGGI